MLQNAANDQVEVVLADKTMSDCITDKHVIRKTGEVYSP